MPFLHRDHTYLHALLFYMWPVPLGFHLIYGDWDVDGLLGGSTLGQGRRQ